MSTFVLAWKMCYLNHTIYSQLDNMLHHIKEQWQCITMRQLHVHEKFNNIKCTNIDLPPRQVKVSTSCSWVYNIRQSEDLWNPTERVCGKVYNEWWNINFVGSLKDFYLFALLIKLGCKSWSIVCLILKYQSQLDLMMALHTILDICIVTSLSSPKRKAVLDRNALIYKLCLHQEAAIKSSHLNLNRSRTNQRNEESPEPNSRQSLRPENIGNILYNSLKIF